VIRQMRFDLGRTQWLPAAHSDSGAAVSMAGVKHLAGVDRDGVLEHQTRIRRHGEKEESKGKSPRAFLRPGRARGSRAWCDGGWTAPS